ncbi:MAG: hypothetical protein Q6373_015435 [Candidatus Sigynarchaeota archaeon]
MTKKKRPLSTKQKVGRAFLVLALIGAGAFGVFAVLVYTAPSPQFTLPVHDLAMVSGIQVFHDNRSTGQVHNGFDFKLENPTEIFAPAGGMVTQISKHQMSNGYWIIDVTVTIDARWSYFIAFEPWTTNPSVIDAQMQNISVHLFQSVNVNDSIGFLVPVPGSEFPHIHWNVNEHTLDFSSDNNRSPYDYCSPHAKAQLYNLCRFFGKYPAD